MSVQSDLAYNFDNTGADSAIDAATEVFITSLVNLGGSHDNAVSIDVTAAGMLDILATIWLHERRRARALHHWATVRLYVRMHPYALHWYEYACKQLCAPGGAWATRDRAAFEADFT
jgi:hypothetical protein